METTNIKFKRARSFSNEGLASMIQTRNVVAEYGEPLVYTSNYYNNDQNCGKNHLFVTGDFSNASNTQQPNYFHVGPYYGVNGIVVNNNPNVAGLGSIDCLVYFTKKHSIADKETQYEIGEIPQYHTRHIIDNSQNSEDLQIVLPEEITSYYTDVEDNLLTVSAGSIKMFTFTIVDDGSLVIEAKSLTQQTND